MIAVCDPCGPRCAPCQTPLDLSAAPPGTSGYREAARLSSFVLLSLVTAELVLGTYLQVLNDDCLNMQHKETIWTICVCRALLRSCWGMDGNGNA